MKMRPTTGVKPMTESRSRPKRGRSTHKESTARPTKRRMENPTKRVKRSTERAMTSMEGHIYCKRTPRAQNKQQNVHRGLLRRFQKILMQEHLSPLERKLIA